jgi:hypothetical protein
MGDYFAVNEAMGGTGGYPYGHGVTIAGSNIMIEAGGKLHANDEGFPSAKYSYVSYAPGPLGVGPGGVATYDVSGASHGGQPGASYDSPAYADLTKRTALYGSAIGPTALGSGGNQHNFSGGGAIKVDVTGTITVNGTLSADVSTTGNPSGSGGSIWIASGTLEGDGRISANGGHSSVGNAAPGGGRIDVSGTTFNFTGSIHARGGSGGNAFSRGQAGSVVLPPATMDSFMPYGTNFVFGNSLAFGDCVVSNGVVLTLDANEGQNVFTFRSLTVKDGGQVVCMGNVQAFNFAAGGATNEVYGEGVVILASNVTIEAGGSLNADGKGFDSSILAQFHAANSAYGGQAGAFTGKTYGPISNVTSLGSGAAVAGGGAIRLVVDDTLTVDGALTCDGAGTAAGNGGAGGSVWIECATLQGSGVISADGSAVGTVNRNGGGGRIHMDYAALGGTRPAISAFGGGTDPALKGAAGTILVRDLSSSESLGSLVIANDTAATNSATELPDSDLTLDRLVMASSYVVVKLDRTLAATTAVSNDNVFVGGAVALVGTNDAVVSGSAFFSDFRIDDTDKVVRFEAGQTNTVLRELSLNLANLQSTVPGAWWYLNCAPGAVQDVLRVRVSDSHAGGGATIRVQSRQSRNDGNNVNWFFPATGGLLIIQ